MDLAVSLPGIGFKPFEKEAVIFIGEEAGLAIVATGDDVLGDVGQSQAGAAGHGRLQSVLGDWSLAWINCGLSPIIIVKSMCTALLQNAFNCAILLFGQLQSVGQDSEWNQQQTVCGSMNRPEQNIPPSACHDFDGQK